MGTGKEVCDLGEKRWELEEKGIKVGENGWELRRKRIKSGRKEVRAGRKWEENCWEDVCENGMGKVRTGRKRG